MKTVVKSILVAATVGLFAIPASASSYVVTSPVNAQDTVVKDTVKKETVKKEVPPMFLAQEEVTYTKIETSELPEAVTKGVEDKYAGYTIEEVYKGNDTNYKMVIKKDDTKLTVLFKEAGEFVKELSEKAEGTVLA